MSYSSDPGKADAPYIPPPPPAKRRSPWMFVGIGCGLLFLLVVGGIAVVSVTFVNKVKTAMNAPFDKEAALKSLEDVPIYPGATVDEQTSKAQRAVFQIMEKVMPAESMTALAFVTEDDSDKIIDWYNKKLESLGYSQHESGSMSGAGSSTIAQQQYKKGKDVVMVQIQRNTRPKEEGTNFLILLRLKNIKGKM
jgi:hypothetical protein